MRMDGGRVGMRLWMAVAASLLMLPASLGAEQVGNGWCLVEPRDEQKLVSSGDVVVEDGDLRVAISARTGRAAVYTLRDGEKKVEIDLVPRESSARAIRVVDRRSKNPVVAIAWSTPGGTGDSRAILSFKRKGIIEVAAPEGVALHAEIERAVLPDFVAGDLIYSPQHLPSAMSLPLPSDQVIVGLLAGGDDLLTVVLDGWEETEAPLLGKKAGSEGPFESLEFRKGGGRTFVSLQYAQGIWHREALGSRFLERDVTVAWQRPFKAKWKTQLEEDGVRTTYAFRSSKKKRFWRGAFGTYTYPVWFDGGKAAYRLGKKIRPRGESLVYFVEGTKDTPDSLMAPSDVVRLALGKEAHQRFLDREGRKKTQDGRPNHCVGTATCGVTDKLKPIFEEGREVEERDYIQGGIEDMIHHLDVLTSRVHEYRAFARDMQAFLEGARPEDPKAVGYIDEMIRATGEFEAAYEAQKENIKTLTYANELGQKTATLSRKKRPGNKAAFLKLKGRWTGMGGALEGMVRKLHTVARDLSQRAAYGCVEHPEAAALAREIRRRITQHLRNPIGYEMWACD